MVTRPNPRCFDFFNDFMNSNIPAITVSFYLTVIGLFGFTPADVTGAEARSDAANGEKQIGETY